MAVIAAESLVELRTGAYDAPRETGHHAHREGQLFALSGGLQVIETPSGRRVQPPGWIGWIAPLCAHAAHSIGATAGWSLYIARGGAAGAGADRGIVSLGAAQEDRRVRLVAVLIDELAADATSSLHSSMPQDKRLAKMAAALADEPSLPETIDDWAVRIGMARRTLTRRFLAETGLRFAQWRQQAWLLKVVELLSIEEPVTSVALTVGDSSVSAFIEAFRRNFGCTSCTSARFFGTKKSRLAPAFEIEA